MSQTPHRNAARTSHGNAGLTLDNPLQESPMLTPATEDLDHTLARAADGLALARAIRRSLTERVAPTAAPTCLWRR